jgi:hypothetical protein
MIALGTACHSMGDVMGKFLLVTVIVAAVVIGVLYYTGYDVIGQLTDDVNVRSYLPPRSIMANLAVGIVSGLIVALITSMFARR